MRAKRVCPAWQKAEKVEKVEKAEKSCPPVPNENWAWMN